MKKIKKQEALDFHSEGRPGKIQVVPTKKTNSQRNLSLAYSPGVAEPCIRIFENKDDIYKYTAKGNLVAVITDGSAVLGLGNIGPEASKPVMEGKGLLFKMYADIDVFDLELNTSSVDSFVSTVKSISPTFGGINLEDIKAPECFEIEKKLKKFLDIPVMHDDQHGTAIISGAALINALELVEKNIKDVKIVINGAGAASISCANIYLSLGANLKNIIMLDSKGVIRKNRRFLETYKSKFATKLKIDTLEEAILESDVFIGLSKGNILTAKMIKSMSNNPIVFAMANPDPEISYSKAILARKDIIFATGRSDFPNQVNNVLGFPYIFRGALDVRAKCINEEMKIAAVRAIAHLAKESVPEDVKLSYDKKNLCFNKDYIIPKPNDPRLISEISSAVAKAAIDSGVARKNIIDWDNYKQSLNNRIGNQNKLIQRLTNIAKSNFKKIVFAEADQYNVLKAAYKIKEEKIAEPILLGRQKKIMSLIEENSLEFGNVNIIDPKSDELQSKVKYYANKLWKKRSRSGFTEYNSRKLMRERNYFASMMVELGDADAMISGFTRNYPETIKPALQIVGTKYHNKKVAGLFIIMTNRGPLFIADTTININPNSEELADITELVADAVEKFGIKPVVAMLSYSNFGSTRDSNSLKVKKAVSIIKKRRSDLILDGEIQGNFAVNNKLLLEKFPFSELIGKKVNVLIFPNLESGNISYKLLQELGGFETIGPILVGLNKSIHIVQLGASVKDIFNISMFASVDALNKN